MVGADTVAAERHKEDSMRAAILCVLSILAHDTHVTSIRSDSCKDFDRIAGIHGLQHRDCVSFPGVTIGIGLLICFIRYCHSDIRLR